MAAIFTSMFIAFLGASQALPADEKVVAGTSDCSQNGQSETVRSCHVLHMFLICFFNIPSLIPALMLDPQWSH